MSIVDLMWLSQCEGHADLLRSVGIPKQFIYVTG